MEDGHAYGDAGRDGTQLQPEIVRALIALGMISSAQSEALVIGAWRMRAFCAQLSTDWALTAGAWCLRIFGPASAGFECSSYCADARLKWGI